jgi:hypothetical protein
MEPKKRPNWRGNGQRTPHVELIPHFRFPPRPEPARRRPATLPKREPMRKTLLTASILLLPATAFAQAQGGPDAPKTDAAKPAAGKPADAKPADGAKPADAKPTEAAKAEEPSAGGPAGPGAATEAAAGGTVTLGATPSSTPAGNTPNVPTPRSEGPRAVTVPAQVARQSAMSYEEAEAQWKFSFHGYLRAPMRIGMGKRLPEDTNGYTMKNQTTMTLHEAVIPDDQYLSFQSTAHNMRSWAEGFFGFGNGVAQGVIGIGSYNLTEGGFNDYEANWGISQAYVLLTPDLGFENARIWAKAGAIVDRYGMAGRYDAGEYDTYMFGRTHVVGETFHLDYDINPLWTLSLEQGFGTHKPDPNVYNSALYTLLHHEHIGLKQGRDLEFGAHYLYSWTQEEYRPTDPAIAPSGVDGAARAGLPNGNMWVAGVDARAELGAFGYIYGAYSHVGANYALTVSRAIEVLHASGGGEYDLGIVSNYLDSPNCHAMNPAETPPAAPAGAPLPPGGAHYKPLDYDACSDGNGYVNALQAHYEFSLTNFQSQINGGPRFWGQGFDAILKLYALATFSKSEARDTTKAPKTGGPAAFQSADVPNSYSVTRAKFGADLTVNALPWLSPALRFDRVMPNNHFSEQNFMVLSPRLVFKTAWVTHEKLTIGYSRYIYDTRVCEPRVPNNTTGVGTRPDTSEDALAGYRCVQAPPSAVPYDGFGTTFGKQRSGTRQTGVERPDENVFKIEATMWW